MNFFKIFKKLICIQLVLLELLTFGMHSNVVYADGPSKDQPKNYSTTGTNTNSFFHNVKGDLHQSINMAIGELITRGMICAGTITYHYVSTGISSLAKNIFYKNQEGFNSLQDSQKNLEKIVSETSTNELYGQEEAKEKMFSYVMSSLCNIEKLNRDPKSDSNVSGNVIYLLGPSGCGKSTMAKSVAQAVLKDPKSTLLFIDPSAISTAKTLDKQLFRTLEKKDFKNEDKTYGIFDKEQKAPILDHIDKKKQAVIIIDDYDKMKMMQANQASSNTYNEDGTVVEDRTADEILKSIAENGKYYVDGNEIDCRKVIFLITSNETVESLKQNFGIGGDIGGGYQRLKIVKFDSLKLDACKKIIKRMICRLTKELTDAKGPFKLKSLNLDEQSINNMAEDIYNDKNNQGRLERTLYSDMLALFSRSVGRDNGKSFKVTYKKADEENLVGLFKKLCS